MKMTTVGIKAVVDCSAINLRLRSPISSVCHTPSFIVAGPTTVLIHNHHLPYVALAYSTGTYGP